jgi:hypothetical protein
MKILKIITLFVFVGIINGYSQEKSLYIADNYKTENFDIAIFPKTYIELLPEKRFTPKKEQIDMAEKELRTNLKKLNIKRINQSSTPIIDRKLHRYRRQYIGYIGKNGDEILLINAFWKSSNDKKEIWLNHFFRTLDGGSYYWEIKYNIKTGELFELHINGYA